VSPGAVARPPFIGLTGGIAAGKSAALAIFKELGAATLSTDAVVHELLDHSEVRERLVSRWGEEVAPNGAVDRGRVGAIVFESPDELAWLESQLHPLVGEQVAAWGEGLPEGTSLAVVEVPLLFEAGLEGSFDATVAVVAADDLRNERAGRRGTEALEGRDSRQLPQEHKATRATHVIRNDGTLDELRGQIQELWPTLAQVAGGTS
jgi:dephospho-CoA kinase